MTFRVELPLAMLQDIESVLSAYAGRTLPVYAEAESIRQRWLSENVALEDIVDQILRSASSHRLGFEIDPSQAVEALRGPV